MGPQMEKGHRVMPQSQPGSLCYRGGYWIGMIRYRPVSRGKDLSAMADDLREQIKAIPPQSNCAWLMSPKETSIV
jgi:hypothetical protein